MYTGTLIERLFATVERAEQEVHELTDSQKQRLNYWYAVAQRELAQLDALAEVA
ncbi:MAG: hypothetical protein JOY93_04730 [Acidobacteriales bacterium]|nr:hypothetical protein [Terriglobales bacterium]